MGRYVIKTDLYKKKCKIQVSNYLFTLFLITYLSISDEANFYANSNLDELYKMKDSDYCCGPEMGPQRTKLDRKLGIKELDGSLPLQASSGASSVWCGCVRFLAVSAFNPPRDEY